MMKKISSKIIAVLLACLMVSTVFAGCGKKTGSTDVKNPSGGKKALKGTINVSMAMGAGKAVWEALAKAYMAKNPGVTVNLDDKEGGSAYTDWLGNQLAGGNVTSDIVTDNTVVQYFSEKKFVDFGEYLNKPNPYSGKKWADGLESSAYRSNGPNKEVYALNPASVQVIWFYNKDIFDEVGIANPPQDWDELVSDCEKIKAKGYIPIALAGDAQSFWEMTMGWLCRIYTDQYWKDKEPLVAAKEGDYNYDPEIDGTWKFDISDKFGDTPEKVHFNGLRAAKLMKDGQIGPDSDKYREMYTNFSKVIPKYVEDGFFGTNTTTANQLFVQSKAAMYIDGAWFAAGFDQTMKDAPKKFNLGFFQSPPMKSANIAVNYTRSLGGPNGFYGVINKTKEQNDLTMDFMMYFTSPEGQGVYYKAMEAANQSPAGPSLVKDTKMPEKWASIFETMGYNGECDNDGVGCFGRGFNDEQQSVRAFQDYTQRFFKGQITVDQLSKEMQKVMVDAIPRWLKNSGYRADALDDPSKDPAQK